MKRHLVIGDVHGCREELEQLLERLRYDPAGDVLVLLGDLVNRGEDSAGVLRLARRLDAQCVLGNHDVRLLRVAHGLLAPRLVDNTQDVLEAEDRQELIAWLGSQPLVREFGNVLCVHAGVHPLWEQPTHTLAGLHPLRETPELSFAVTVRTCTPAGERPARESGLVEAPYRAWYEFWLQRKQETRTVAFGHWAVHGLVWLPRVRGLDTGCAWGGKLSGWIVEEDRLVQVDKR
jgi:bis(5'-nucleosyl)-tetraphosphatase (symmetrical)